MKQINRSEFIGTATGLTKGADGQKKPFKEFYNKELPKFSSRSSTGLTKYSGTFGNAELAHLLRRTLFGVTGADMQHFNGKTLDEVVAALLTASSTPTPPLNNYDTTTPPAVNDPDCNFGETWIGGALDFTGIITALRAISFREWWIGLMLGQDRSITEKMTLFWHNHFSTEAEVIQEARYIYKHHALLRANALGNFKTLTKAVSIDPGMLVYLNGNTNIKGAPNENYARELQELFTVGKGPDSHYTEADVIAAARVLTGWKDVIFSKPLSDAHFDVSKHDTADKQFSSFYNNKVITGRNDAGAGETELNELIEMLFAQNETAKHVCRKLYRWFIYYVIDQQVEDDIITPLADLFRTSGYNIVPVLDKLLKSEHFFDNLNRGCLIKNPADYLIGLCRQTGLTFPTGAQLADQYLSWGGVFTYMSNFTMQPGDPPSVAGWPAYYQEPAYHELWINSNTLPARNKLVELIGSEGGIQYRSIKLKIDFIAFAKLFPNPRDPDALIADSSALLSPNPLEVAQVASMKSTLLSGQTANHYWTDAWDDYIATPNNATLKGIVEMRLRTMFTDLLQLPEYHLI